MQIRERQRLVGSGYQSDSVLCDDDVLHQKQTEPIDARATGFSADEEWCCEFLGCEGHEQLVTGNRDS